MHKISDGVKNILPDWIKVAQDDEGEILEADHLDVYKHFFEGMGIKEEPESADYVALRNARLMFYRWIKRHLIVGFGEKHEPVRARIIIDKEFKGKGLPKEWTKEMLVQNVPKMYNELDAAGKLPVLSDKGEKIHIEVPTES